MNYQKIYDNLVHKAIRENRSKNKETYYESHHIIPKCLGGTNSKSNLVILTFREHFICHWLLCKINQNNENYYRLTTAFKRMCSKNKFQQRTVSSRHYEIAKIHERKAKKGVAVGAALIKTRSEAWKNNISKSLNGRPNTWMKNKKYDEIYKTEDLQRILDSRKVSKNKNTITINDGSSMRFIDKHQQIPDGWKQGRIKLNIKKKWYNNGELERCIDITNQIPVGWTKGRLKK